MSNVKAGSMYKPLVSVIIVNWNGKIWLKKCLDSLLSQTYKTVEIIVVDNASTDDSVAYLKSNYPSVALVESDRNRGFAGGNNLGIERSQGELIMLFNNDAWVDKDFLIKLIEKYAQGDNEVLAPLEADYEKRKKQPYETRIDPLGHPTYIYNSEGDKRNFYLSGACILFSKELYKQTGGLDEDFFMYFEEIDWFWRLLLMGKTFSYVDDLYNYHAGAGSTGGGVKYLSFLWRNQNTLQMLLKNYRMINLLWVLPLYLLQNIGEVIVFLLLLKPKIAYTYIQAITFNTKKLPKTLKKRQWVQAHRVCNDSFIFTRMFQGPGKLIHLWHFIHKI